MASTNQAQLAEQLVQASVDLHAFDDARDVARYMTSLTKLLIPTADAVAVNVKCGDVLLTLGVYGYPHFGSTLIIEPGEGLAGLEWARQTTWLRTPAEVAAATSGGEHGEQEVDVRTRRINSLIPDTGYRSMVFAPCLIDDAFFGGIMLDAWTPAVVFHRADITTLGLLAQVTALALTGTSYATVFDDRGQTYRRAMGQTSTRAADDPPTQAIDVASPLPSAPALSRREHEILALIAVGLTNADIAAKLYVSPNTVRSHRRSLMRKLDSHNIVELVQTARDRGLVDM